MGDADSASDETGSNRLDVKGTEPPTSEEAGRVVPGERRGKRHRRVTTTAVPGSDPAPQPEPRRHDSRENDERLKADKPPHWRA